MNGPGIAVGVVGPDALHGLWTTLSLLAAAGWAAGALTRRRRERRTRLRTRSVLDPSVVPGRRERWPRRRVTHHLEHGVLARLAVDRRDVPWREVTASLGAGLALLTLIDGAVGWLLGAGAGCGVWWWLRRRGGIAGDGGATPESRAATAQLPLIADLLAACLAAGARPPQAAEAVGRSLGGPLGHRLAQCAEELRLGGEPAVVWGRFGELPGAAGLARHLERAEGTGVPAVEAVSRYATELRARRTRETNGRARRVGVLVAGPLGLCFLPAFLVVGVAPVVLGLAGSLR
ncbi:type II secretion system F family protein [Streptomyces sp. AJS327]|uniref:type II secretion system F family protein n=1 Tax=Streptomyces sp. AJS327 TaxID=2545265 RepID=UPI0015DF82BA|nr:type II secretion system F family protein [Streptomyces sp. AJS327]